MSSGPFTKTFYETNKSESAGITVQPETISAANPAFTGPQTTTVRATVGGSRRQRGRLFARGAYVYRDLGSGDLAFRRYNFIPILTLAAFNALEEGDTIQAGGQTWTVQSFRGQSPANV